MSQPAERFARYQDILALPEHLVGEIIHGALVTHPRPAPKHLLVSSSLGDELTGPFYKGRGGPGGWWILDEPELHLGPNVLVPDLAGWRRERLPCLPETAYFEVSPDWLCEVLSPATARTDRADKLPLYAAHAADWCWLLDPDLRTLEVLQRQERHWLLIGTFKDDAQVQAPPFADITLDLSVLWA
jgi:Uma2 family endonuclease